MCELVSVFADKRCARNEAEDARMEYNLLLCSNQFHDQAFMPPVDSSGVIKQAMHRVRTNPSDDAWAGLLDAIARDGGYIGDQVTLHAMFLQTTCPIKHTFTYIKTVLPSSNDWVKTFKCARGEVHSIQGVTDSPACWSAFDLLLLGGSMVQLEQILKHFPNLVWRSVQESVRLTERHPLTIMQRVGLFPDFLLKKAVLLWKYVFIMLYTNGRSYACYEKYFVGREVWLRNPCTRARLMLQTERAPPSSVAARDMDVECERVVTPLYVEHSYNQLHELDCHANDDSDDCKRMRAYTV